MDDKIIDILIKMGSKGRAITGGYRHEWLTHKELAVLKEAGVPDDQIDNYQVVQGKVYKRCGCGCGY